MKNSLLTVYENTQIAANVMKMVLLGDHGGFDAPGQFINIKVEGLYLRRPISVCDLDKDGLTIIYKIVGDGTHTMSRAVPGDVFDVLCGLGNGYDLSQSGDFPLLIGGGVGVPPLYGLCRKLIEEGKNTTVIMGFNTKNEVFLSEEFTTLGADVRVATADGTFGARGYVTDLIGDIDYSYFYTCGPEPMLKAVDKAVTGSGQFSFEERMGCGFGACMGCTCRTKYGNKRICKDGPVLTREEIIW